MARRKNQQNIEETEDLLVEQVETTEDSGSFLENNQKTIFGALLGAAVIIGLFFAYNNLVKKPKMSKAAHQLSQAQFQFERDSFTAALTNPGGGFLGFLDIINQYGGTPAGNTANYYAGVSYLHLGDYNKAIEYLKSYSATGDIMPAMKNGAMGDAYSELQDYDQAISFYQKAGNATNNEFIAGEYLKKLGMLQEKQKNYAGALSTFKALKEKYPKSVAGRDAEKLIARVSALVN